MIFGGERVVIALGAANIDYAAARRLTEIFEGKLNCRAIRKCSEVLECTRGRRPPPISLAKKFADNRIEDSRLLQVHVMCAARYDA